MYMHSHATIYASYTITIYAGPIFLQITFFLHLKSLVSCQFSRTFLHPDMPAYYTAKLNPSCPKSVFLKIHTKHKWQFYNELLGQCTLKLRRTDQASQQQALARDRKGQEKEKGGTRTAHQSTTETAQLNYVTQTCASVTNLFFFFLDTCCEVWGRLLRNTKWMPKTYSQRFTAARFVANSLLAIGRLEEGLESPCIWEWKDVRTSSYASIHLPWQNFFG